MVESSNKSLVKGLTRRTTAGYLLPVQLSSREVAVLHGVGEEVSEKEDGGKRECAVGSKAGISPNISI